MSYLVEASLVSYPEKGIRSYHWDLPTTRCNKLSTFKDKVLMTVSELVDTPPDGDDLILTITVVREA